MHSSSRYTKLFLLCVFLVIATLKAFSQEYSYINYDTRDGLAGSVVYDAIQDHEGFMWFATDNGLSRFDGKNFKTFTTKDGLPDNEILKLFVDSKGRVWAMPFKPSLCYYFRGKIYNKNNDTLLSKISMRTFAFEMVEDKSGNIFVAEETRIHILFKNGGLRMIDKLYNTPFFQLALGVDQDKEAELVGVGDFHVDLWHPTLVIFYPLANKVKEINDIPSTPDVSISQVTPEYVLIPKKLDSRLAFYKDTAEVFSTKIPSNTVSVNYVNNRKIILNTTAGIKFLDPKTKAISQSFFKNFSITSTYQDKENNLWLTTSGSGVLMVPSLQFKNFSSSDNGKPEITAICRIGDTVYAGGWDKKIWRINVNNLTPLQTLGGTQDSKLISILSVNNELFFASSYHTLNPFNRERVNVPQLTLKSASVGKSGIILATHRNATLCRPSGKEDTLWEGRTTSAIESDSGFYIGTINGLFYKTYSGKIKNLGSTLPALSSRIVNVAASENTLWITTKGSGVVGYANGKLLYHFTEKDGLTSDNCTSLFVDNNVVWVGTEKGINRIDISRNQITHFSMSDGLPSNIINAIAASGNNVFAGTPKGLTYFEVNKISQASTCDLQLTGIYVANKYWCYDSTNFSLAHKNNDIRFEFSGISFKSAGEMIYKYRLLGLQPEWRTTTENELSFPTLSSGAYTLQLKVVNKYGVESKTKEVSFIIEKLLWEKTWFRIGIAILLAAVVWSYTRFRVKSIRGKEKEKTAINKRIAELEQTALRSQMNPHFIFNCLNSIQQYVAERDITGANQFITDFSRLIRMTLDLSTHSLISLRDEVEYISTYLRVEKARLEGTFDYCLYIDETLDMHAVYLPPLLLQPYLENSIRHGIRYKTDGDGLIQINIIRKNEGVLIQIQDNGIGRQASKKYKSEFHIQYQSRGMTINEDRIKMLNNTVEKRIELMVTDLYNSNEEAVGTRVDVYLPS
jgi:ligand-binding sensor domain-containing protein